jgi:6-phosphofructokinase
MVDFMEAREIDILFCIGGDGTQRGAHGIQQEIETRGLPKSVVGIPKTIDNDVPFVELSFGYVTALEVASEVLRGAHVEAVGAPNGVGLVKLMGRAAGFIAAGAAIASQEANFVLVPEVPFPLEGEGGFLEVLERRILTRGHAVIVVAEGAGQHLFDGADAERDASGNVRFEDIGVFLRHPKRSGQRVGSNPDGPNGARRGPRRDGRQDRRDGGILESRDRLRADLHRRGAEEADPPRIRPLERRARYHPPAGLALARLCSGRDGSLS